MQFELYIYKYSINYKYSIKSRQKSVTSVTWLANHYSTMNYLLHFEKKSVTKV